jgi:hypothetical protein
VRKEKGKKRFCFILLWLASAGGVGLLGCLI